MYIFISMSVHVCIWTFVYILFMKQRNVSKRKNEKKKGMEKRSKLAWPFSRAGPKWAFCSCCAAVRMMMMTRTNMWTETPFPFPALSLLSPLPRLAATTGRAAAPFVSSSPSPLPATSILQVCPPLLFPSAVWDGAPQTLTKLSVFGSESSYNRLPTNFDFVCKNYRVYMCTTPMSLVAMDTYLWTTRNRWTCIIFR